MNNSSTAFIHLFNGWSN